MEINNTFFIKSLQDQKSCFIFVSTKTNNIMSTTANKIQEAKHKALFNNKEFKAELKNLYNAELGRRNVTALMQPKYDALLLNVEMRMKNERRQLAYDNSEFEMKWSNIYMLADDVFALLMEEKNKIDKENDFEVELNYCPILIAEDAVRNSIAKLIKFHGDNIDPSYHDVFLNLNHYNSFKEIMIKAVFNNARP